MIPFSRAIIEPQLFANMRPFRDPASWAGWIAFDRAMHGEPLDASELELFQRHTGRTVVRPEGYDEGVAILGRRSGKTQWHSTRLAFDAATTTDARGLYWVIVAQDARSAMRAAFAPVVAAFEESPILRPLVASLKQESIELTNGAVVAVYPARPAALRGISAAAVYLDEFAFLISSEGRAVDVELLRAARPMLATTGGKLYITSSPYGQAGALYDLHRLHFGNDTSRVLVWQASAPDMNPTLPADYLERMRAEDPEGAASEVDGQFRAGLSVLLASDALDACVGDHREVPPQDGIKYFGHYDASGGRADAAALAIGHRDGELVRIDLVRQWRAPHNPKTVIAEAAEILKQYRVSKVQLDRYGGEFPGREFAVHGIRSEIAKGTTSDHHVGIVPLVNAERLVLPNDATLLRELRGLQRRTGSGGRERVDHMPGSHDDVAASVTGLCAILASRRGTGDTGVTL